MKTSPFILLALLISSTSHAEVEELLGSWWGGDKAAQAIYQVLTITKDHISWPKTNNLQKCSVPYKVVSKEKSNSYPHESVAAGVIESRNSDYFTVIRIELEANECSRKRKAFQFAISKDNPKLVWVVDYEYKMGPRGDTDWQLDGKIHFFR